MTQKYNITVNQGVDFQLTFEVTDEDGDPIDYSAYTGVAEFRKSYLSTNSVSFSVSIDLNEVTISLAGSDTANVAPGKYEYDVLVRDATNANSEKIMEGIMVLDPTISRWP